MTGTVSGRNNDTAIEEGKIKGEEVSFQVTREFNGNKMVIKYTGKVSGDTITGKWNHNVTASRKRATGWPSAKLPPK